LVEKTSEKLVHKNLDRVSRAIYNYLPSYYGSNYIPQRDIVDYNISQGFVDYNNVQLDPLTGDYDNTMYNEDPNYGCGRYFVDGRWEDNNPSGGFIEVQVNRIATAEEELLHGKYKAKMNIEVEEEDDDQANQKKNK